MVFILALCTAGCVDLVVKNIYRDGHALVDQLQRYGPDPEALLAPLEVGLAGDQTADDLMRRRILVRE